MEPVTKSAIPGTMQAATMSSFHGLDDPERWTMERKLDGFRLLCVLDNGEIEGYSRAHNAQRIGEKLPHVKRCVKEIFKRANAKGFTVIDGELTTVDDDFSHVAGVMKSLPLRARALQHIDAEGDYTGLIPAEQNDRRLHYAVFDVLYWDGQDARSWILDGRRGLLENFFETKKDVTDDTPVYLTDVFPPSEKTVRAWMDAGGEGAIVKSLTSEYKSGKRPPGHWYKYKVEGESDVVVMGFTDGREGKGVRRMTDTIGAICFGQYTDDPCDACDGKGEYHDYQRTDDGEMKILVTCDECFGVGSELKYRGQVSGMDDALRFGIRDKLKGVNTESQYLGKVMVIRHNLIQVDGYRNPRFLYFRDDKPLAECTWE